MREGPVRLRLRPEPRPAATRLSFADIRGDGGDARAAGGLPVLPLGDLNTASSEPAFDRFVVGLRDVHAEVGEGTGWTWRPLRFEFLGLGLIRIDHVVVTPGSVPTGAGIACPTVADHCLVRAELAIPVG